MAFEPGPVLESLAQDIRSQLEPERTWGLVKDLLLQPRPEPGVVTYLINAYVEAKKPEQAIEIVRLMQQRAPQRPDAAPWISLINAFVADGQADSVLLVVREMQQQGFVPSVTTYQFLPRDRACISRRICNSGSE